MSRKAKFMIDRARAGRLVALAKLAENDPRKHRSEEGADMEGPSLDRRFDRKAPEVHRLFRRAERLGEVAQIESNLDLSRYLVAGAPAKAKVA